MKKKAEQLDESHGLVRQIRDTLLDLEKKHQGLEKIYEQLIVDAARLVSLNEDADSFYAAERSYRLKDLLLHLRKEQGYRPDKYHRLYKNLDRISSLDIGAYLNPVIGRQIRSIASGSNRWKKEDAVQQGYRSHYFRTGDMVFLAYGRVFRIISGINIEKAKRLKIIEADGPVFFPGGNGSFGMDDDDIRDLMLMRVKPGGTVYGLWYDEYLRSEDGFPEFVFRRLQALKTPHTLIRGRFMREGSPIYFFHPPDSEKTQN